MFLSWLLNVLKSSSNIWVWTNGRVWCEAFWYIGRQKGFSVWQLIKSDQSTACSTLPLNYITGDACKLHFTAVKCIEPKIECETWVSWIFGRSNVPYRLHWTCSRKSWEIFSEYLFPTATRACTGLMDGCFSLAIHHVMSIRCGEENMFVLRVLCVMELFNERIVLCLLRNTAVDHNDCCIYGAKEKHGSCSFTPVPPWYCTHIPTYTQRCAAAALRSYRLANLREFF